MLTTPTFHETAYAAETIKDEAGRTIYTIDDDGNVTMFPNCPPCSEWAARRQIVKAG